MREQAVRPGGQPEFRPEPDRTAAPRVPDADPDPDRLDTDRLDTAEIAAEARVVTGNETTAELTTGELPLDEEPEAPAATAASAAKPVWRRPPRRPFKVHVAFTLVLVIAAAGVVRIAQYHWREGSVLIGGALLVAALLRAVLPPTRVGLMAVRGRAVDVLTYAALAACVLFIAITLQNGPYA